MGDIDQDVSCSSISARVVGFIRWCWVFFLADMHAKPVVDRSSVWEEDGSPDSASRVPNIGDIDMSTVNRVLYQVGYPCTQRVV